MADKYYVGDECEVCGEVCGSRLCDGCKDETEILFRALCKENFNSDQLIYLSECLDGVYLTDYLKG